jgi:hypothetical protein
MFEQKINLKIADMAQIPMNINGNSQKTTVLTEFFVVCLKCGTKEIIMRKKAGNWKLGVCNACNVRTWLRVLGKVKRFGKNDQFVKLVYLHSRFEAFWLNCVGNQ